jgi:hypothetical protein
VLLQEIGPSHAVLKEHTCSPREMAKAAA